MTCLLIQLYPLRDDYFSLPSERVIRQLKQIISWRDKPHVIRCADLGFCHNGPEYISGAIQSWAAKWAQAGAHSARQTPTECLRGTLQQDGTIRVVVTVLL